MEWEGQWISSDDMDGPYKQKRWPAWLKPFEQAYELYRDRRTNGGIIRCMLCDLCLQLPIYPTNSEKVRGRRWLADHWLSHVAAGGGLLILDGDDS